MNEQRDITGIRRNWPDYEVEEVLGHGSYGRVYKIKRDYLGSRIFSALKVIHIPPSNDMRNELESQGLSDRKIREYYRELVDNFLNENTVMEKLKGAANIVTVEDCKVEEDPTEEGYNIYIKMELLESMDSLMRNYMLTTDDIVTIGKDICEALIVCEQKNIIHRDIKPANVFLNEFGTFKLGDFGVARQMQHTRTNMTQIGTGMYMAPELYRGEAADKRVDIYSLGIMLYRLANQGCFPFVDPDTLSAVSNANALAKRLKGEALPLPSQVDGELGRIILKACAYRAEDRYGSAKELRDALTGWELKHKYREKLLDEIKKEETAKQQRKVQEERRYREQEDRRRAQEAQQRREAEVQRRAEEERQRREAEVQRRAEEERRRQEAEAQKRTQEAQRNQVSAGFNQSNDSNDSKRKSPIAAVAGVLVLVLICAFVYLGTNSQEDTDNEGKSISIAEDKKTPAVSDTGEINDSWEEIAASIEDGTYAEKYSIGDSKELDLGSEGVITMEIVAMDTDDLADGSGKAALTWIAAEALSTEHRMNPDSEYSNDGYKSGTGSIGGWKKSEMRSWLQESILPLFPSEVAGEIKTVKKTQEAHDTSGDWVEQTTKDKIWIPSYDEVFGSDAVYYEYFQDKDDNRIRKKAGASGASWWWLRSPIRRQL